MSHKHSFSLGGHSVTSDIGGGHSERDPKDVLFGFLLLYEKTKYSLGRAKSQSPQGTYDQEMDSNFGNSVKFSESLAEK